MQYWKINKPLVNELNGLTRSVTLAITSILSLLHKLPIPLYEILEKINSSYVPRLVYIYLFTIKQKGLKIISSYLKRKIRNWRFEENR